MNTNKKENDYTFFFFFLLYDEKIPFPSIIFIYAFIKTSEIRNAIPLLIHLTIDDSIIGRIYGINIRIWMVFCWFLLI